jgi:hypothetical protein
MTVPRNAILPLFLSLLVALAGCNRSKIAPPLANLSSSSTSPTAQLQSQIDACSLLTASEIQEVQGSALTDSKKSEHSDGAFRVSQCYFAAAEANKSVSLAVTQRSGQRSPKDYWRETFGRFSDGEKERDEKKEEAKKPGDKAGRDEEEHEATPPRKIDGVGDAAFWSGDRVGGALYVLKNDVFIRLSVGGGDDQETKIAKSKALAAKALARF